MKPQSFSKSRSINPAISRHNQSNASMPSMTNQLNPVQDGYTKIHHNRDQTFIPPAPQTQQEQQKYQAWSEKRHNAHPNISRHNQSNASVASTQSVPTYNNNYNNNRNNNTFAAPNINPSMQPSINRPMSHHPMNNRNNSTTINHRNMSYNSNISRNNNINNNQQSMTPRQQPISQQMPNIHRFSTVPPNMNISIQQNTSNTQYSAHRGPTSPVVSQQMNGLQPPQIGGHNGDDQYIELGANATAVGGNSAVISSAWATSRPSPAGSVVRASVSKSKSAYKEPLLEDDIDYENVGDRKTTVKKSGCCTIL